MILSISHLILLDKGLSNLDKICFSLRKVSSLELKVDLLKNDSVALPFSESKIKN